MVNAVLLFLQNHQKLRDVEVEYTLKATFTCRGEAAGPLPPKTNMDPIEPLARKVRTALLGPQDFESSGCFQNCDQRPTLPFDMPHRCLRKAL